MKINKNNMEMINWDLLAKYLAGEADEKERSDIESWINRKEENKQELARVRNLLENTDLYYQQNRFNNTRAFNTVLSKIKNHSNLNLEKQNNTVKKFFLDYFKYAAVAVIILSVGTILYLGTTKNNKNDVSQQLAFTEIELPKTVILPDSTIVTLNKESEILYPEKFTGNTRNVEIRGEAFFEVTPNAQKPFIITAGDAQVKVLGTSFNVNAYPASETVEVIVETGKVQVSKNEIVNTEEIFLDPGEKATFYKKDKKINKQKNEDPNYNSWKTYNIVFKESKLSYVIEVLEKTYHVDIQAENPEIENEVLVAEFNNKPIEFILDVIRLTFNLELLVENGRYILKSSNL